MRKIQSRLINLLLLISLCFPEIGLGQKISFPYDEKNIYVYALVKSAITNEYVEDANTITLDKEGNPLDTIRTSFTMRSGDDEKVFSQATLMVPRNDTVIMFDVIAPGFEPKRVSWEVKNVGKREVDRQMPTIFLDRAAKRLNEFTVTASKIKFYNKGDTIVYNADAFQLAEGSMLDALIEQLPGVELKDDGQIFVNGEFVESLLLNGRQFLDGNNQLMLENIAAYTVKSVEVYKGQTDFEKWENDSTKMRHLTMDVRMKKEYMRGWIVNAQGGYGTKERYMGRLFAMLFTPTTNVTVLGNVNNLNDNKKPGKSGSWTPDKLPSGTKTYRMGSINYDYKKKDESMLSNGHFIFEHSSLDSRVMTNRENFLTGGNTFENSFSNSSNTDTKLETRHNAEFYRSRSYIGGTALGRYIKKSQRSNDISATFNSEQTDITADVLDALYISGTQKQLDALINRNLNRTDGSSHEGEFQLSPRYTWKVPGSQDRLNVDIGVKYHDRKEDRWKDFEINFGNNPNPAEKHRQYFDNSPNRSYSLNGNLEYSMQVKKIRLSLDYGYSFNNDDKDSYMYALERLEDIGIYGTVPANYLDAFDPANSYTSRLISNKHSIAPEIGGVFFKDTYTLMFNGTAEFGFVDRHLDYWRDGRTYLVDKKNLTTMIKKGQSYVTLYFSKFKDSQNRITYQNTVSYHINADTKLPDLAHTIDVINTADPLNITLGNPDLKPSTVWGHSLRWNYVAKPPVNLNNTFDISYDYTLSDIVRGYTYDTATGIRRTRSYNVDGNRNFSIGEFLTATFGRLNMFSASLDLTYDINRYSDMIGVNMETPAKSVVKSNLFRQTLTFGTTLGKQSLNLKFGHMGRKTTSTREDFHLIDADNFNYGIQGTFTLPYGFGLSTDFMIYSRRGYGSKELDRDDAIWNLRATWATKNKRWVFMADAFDMLHQLSNVNYGISASGRTVTWTNALPRYLLFTVQYRITIQPKKRQNPVRD